MKLKLKKLEELSKEETFFIIGGQVPSKKPPLKTVALIFRLDPKGHKTHS